MPGYYVIVAKDENAVRAVAQSQNARIVEPVHDFSGFSSLDDGSFAGLEYLIIQGSGCVALAAA